MKSKMTIAAAFLALSASAMSIKTGSTGPERFAGKELDRWLGCLASNPLDVDFRLGTEYASEFPEDASFIGSTDGYAVRRRGNVVYIFANEPRGVLYGVYDFLERNSDIIFARANEDFGIVYTPGGFRLQNADFREKPVFQSRGWWICWTHCDPGTEYWNARMRCNGQCAEYRGKGVPARSEECGFEVNPVGGHNLYMFMPTNEFAAHPECFPMRNGVRLANVRGEKGNQLCFSHPKTAEICARELVKMVDANIAKGVKLTAMSFKHEDNQRLCECPLCLSDIILPDGRRIGKDDPGFRTTQVFRFKNKVAEIFSRKHPSIRLKSYAYQFTAPPPEIKVHNLYDISFCPYPKNDKYSILSEQNAKWKSRVDAWAKNGTTNLVWREYYGCGASFPRPLAETTQVDLQYIYEKLGISRVTSEYSPDLVVKWARRDLRKIWDMSAMEFWVISHLYWNPYQDVAKLRSEYIRRAYRKAAGPMGRFHKLIRDAWYSDPRPSWWNDDAFRSAKRYIKEKGLENSCRVALEEAAKAAEGDLPQVRMMVSRTRDRFEEWMKSSVKAHEVLNVPMIRDARLALKGDESKWQKSAKIDRFAPIGNKKGKPLFPTVLQFMHDNDNLYVRFFCADNAMDRLEAMPFNKSTDMKKEKFPSGDHVELFFEGGLKDDDYFHLVVDANGNRYDAKCLDRTFSAPWSADVKRSGAGYAVTFVLPFKSFAIEPVLRGRFGMLAMRTVSHGGELVQHSTLYGEAVHRPSGFVEINLK